jgi:hypothetical protein
MDGVTTLNRMALALHPDYLVIHENGYNSTTYISAIRLLTLEQHMTLDRNAMNMIF